MNKPLALAALLACSGPSPQAQATSAQPQRVPPGPQCLDARHVSDARQADPRTLAIASGISQFHRVTLATDCPGVDTAHSAQLLAHDGWVCGDPNEFVQADDQRCAVASVAPIDGRTFAAMARQADQADGVATLDTVKVQGPQRGQGFRGSPSYCFAPRFVRSWSADPGGLLVEVSRRHPGGHGWYRVELSGSCPELARSPQINFRSRMDLGMICGNPGDVVVPTARPEGFANGGLGAATCNIGAVYPTSKVN
ncbi:DUF6491 family protein [Pseudoxanthomonas spadix]|uniref:DUF6491 family protein n=1 Tax=Pseudoxanthomonas spadix TaxID=415229 RepID=UPI000EFEAACB|nr:hypothetical protein [Pseudoxanthomonas spadix]MBP3975249.1 hypothetical protein [Pseudoxanthomonas spadix]RMW98269.1 hypothetical protein D9R12_01870 [Pseudoxanthomonas spadix]